MKLKPMLIREAAKKSSAFNGRAIKALPPPPSLMADGTWKQNKSKSKKKVIFSLMARPLPSPALGPRPLREEFFFCGFPFSAGKL